MLLAVHRPAISAATGDDPDGMQQIRHALVIAGAGGRMGRTLMQAIAATKGVTLAGAVEAADRRSSAAMPANSPGSGRTASRSSRDVAPLLKAPTG